MFYEIRYKYFLGEEGTIVGSDYKEANRIFFEKFNEEGVANVKMYECMYADCGQKISALIRNRWWNE